MRLHHTHFLRATESRNWSRIADFIAPNYTDRWRHDKTLILRESREVLRQFFVLTISGDVLRCEISGNHARVTAQLKFDGTGTALAANAQQEVNKLQTPFVFEWTRQSWKPWDWQLTRADNAQLQLSDWED